MHALLLSGVWKSIGFKVVAQFCFVSLFSYWMCPACRIVPLFLCQVLFLTCRVYFKWIFQEVHRRLLSCRLLVSLEVLFLFAKFEEKKPVQSDEFKHILKIIYWKCYFSAIFMPLWLKIISFKFLIISCLKFHANWDDTSVNSAFRLLVYLWWLYLKLWTLVSREACIQVFAENKM